MGEGDLWVTEYQINYGGKRAFTVSVMEFRDGKVLHETQYFADPFEAPTWRAQWLSARRDSPRLSLLLTSVAQGCGAGRMRCAKANRSEFLVTHL